jgi:putative ABC transport system permease protein
MLSSLRYTLRQLLKSPGFTITAILILGFATGANTAIFSLINTVLLRPLDYPEPDRMVSINMPTQEQPNASFDYRDYLAYRDGQHTLSCIALENWWEFDLSGQGSAERIKGALATASVFPGNGFPFILGRPYTDAEDQPGGPRVVVLTEPLWRRRFNADPNIIGKDIILNSIGCQVIGVVQAEPEYKSPPELYLPLNLADDVVEWREWRGRDSHFLNCFGRLNKGVTIAEAQADLEVIQRDLIAEFPQDKGYGVRVEDTLYSEVQDYVPMLLLLEAAGGFFLLLSSANVATLLFSRALNRQREMTIRAAMGASRLRLIGHLILESALLALLGGLIGLPIAWFGVEFIKWVSPEDMGRVFAISLDAPSLLFSFGVAALAAISAGLLPSLLLSKKNNLVFIMSGDGSRSATMGPQRARIQSIMITCQVSIACALLIGAVLLVRGFQAAQNAPLGFRPDHLLTGWIHLPNQKYRDPVQAGIFFDRLIENIRRMPGVVAASMSDSPPFSLNYEDGNYTPFAVVGQPIPDPGRAPEVDDRRISSRYFQTIETPILEGRDFNESDQRSGPSVVIINKAFADRLFPGQDPLGKQITTLNAGKPDKRFSIVGVVQNTRHSGPDHHPSKFEAYFPYWQTDAHFEVLIIRSSGDALALLPAVRKTLESVDQDVPLANVQTYYDLIARSHFGRRLASLVVSIFSGAAVLLAAVGLYGVLAYSVSLKTREIGVRIAIGALQKNIFDLVLRQGFRIVGIGILAGLIASLALRGLLGSLLYGVGESDPITIALCVLILCLVAFLACLLPALRAARINPIIALRE